MRADAIIYIIHRGDSSYDGYQKKNVLPTDVREEYDDNAYSRY